MDSDRDPAAEKQREARLRRVASGMGLALRKSRARDPARMDYGCYRIESVDGAYTVAGKFPYGYSLNLEAVEEVLDELEATKEDAGLKRMWLAAHGGGEFDAKNR